MTAVWVIVLAIVALVLLTVLVPPPAIDVGHQAIPEHIQEMSFVDTTRQRHGHLMLMFATAVAAVLLAKSGRLRNALVDWVSRGSLSGAPMRWMAWGASLAILYFSRGHSMCHLLSVATVAALIILGDHPQYLRATGIATGLLLAGYAALVLLPGLIARPDLAASGIPMAGVEGHYSAVISQGDRLSQGFRLFSDVMPQYGFLSMSALAYVEKSHLLSFGAHFRLVQVAQVVFCLAAFGCYWLWSDRRILPTALVFLPILAMVNPRSLSVFFPNQSGWRFAGFPIGLLVLLALRKRRESAALLGLASGGLILFNTETGIALTLGFLFFLLSERDAAGTPPRVLPVLFKFVPFAGILPLIFVISFRMGFGYLPLPFGGAASYSLARYTAGYAGLKLYFEITWVVMLVHAVTEILRVALARSKLSVHDRFRGAVGVVILVWFSYFFNRPHPWNLWTIYFLYGFFIVDFTRPVKLAEYAQEIRNRTLPIGVVVVTMFLIANSPSVLAAGLDGVHVVRHPQPGPRAVVSGIGMPPDYADLLRRRGEYLRTRVRERSLFYFTGNIYSMPLVSGVFSRFGDAYEMFSNDEFEHFAEKISDEGPSELLFDDPRALMAGTYERNLYYGRLKQKVSGAYELRERIAGWEVWDRRTDARVPSGGP
jgi:hypothetical protein